MSSVIFEKGGFSITRCCSRCDACGEVRPGAQYTGANGYATLCTPCSSESLADIFAKAAKLTRELNS